MCDMEVYMMRSSATQRILDQLPKTNVKSLHTYIEDFRRLKNILHPIRWLCLNLALSTSKLSLSSYFLQLTTRKWTHKISFCHLYNFWPKVTVVYLYVGHWAMHRQPGFQLRLDVEPQDPVVIIHLHGTKGVLSCLLKPGSCWSYCPLSPHKRSMASSHIGNVPNF